MSNPSDIRDSRLRFRAPRLWALTALLLVLPVSNMAQQVLDLCGCASGPNLGAFDADNPATYPPGTSGCSSPCNSGTITFTPPPDGIMRFTSFIVDGGFNVNFGRNAANTPVTIL